MSITYTKSVSNDFDNQLNPGQLINIINDNSQINPVCTIIYAVDNVAYIKFNNSLSSAEETELDNIISSYVFFLL